MLSKIKSSTEARVSPISRAASNNSDNEDDTIIDNDTNNNNNNNNNMINNNQPGKRNQDELLDIIEVSRKRRLSKDSADSLTSFIRWSFTHTDPSVQRFADSLSPKRFNSSSADHSNREEDDDERESHRDVDEDAAWNSSLMAHRQQQQQQQQQQQLQQRDFAANQRFRMPEQLLRHQQAKAAGSGATNLVFVRANERPLSLEAALGQPANKRLRSQEYSPEAKIHQANSQSARRSSNYLGNVVDRLHQQQQHQSLAQQQVRRDMSDQESNPSAGLSLHLQQFLQQQTSLEDLCSSVGLEEGNQLVLAAAIHRALVDSAGTANQLGQVDSKSTASSTGSSSSGGNNTNHEHSSFVNSASADQHNNHMGPQNLSSSAGSNNNSTPSLSRALAAAPGANSMHLVDSLSRQRRAYNTRAAIHALSAPMNRAGANANQNSASQVAADLAAAMSANAARAHQQQQRHAQAAAALSALASAGGHHPLHHLAAAASAGGANIANLPGRLGPSAASMVEFKCDICPSSFDDRHRLMQHQSIHLELRKDWFTETPVDEVMKIFNRRRGEFLCNICNLRFEATLDYDQHNHAVHGPRPYCCQFCGNGTRTFKCWRQYLNHLYDHRYIFGCTIDDCDFTVNRRDSLRFHIFRFHLNCQLPQSQHRPRSSNHHNLILGIGGGVGGANANGTEGHLADSTKWPQMEGADGDLENRGDLDDLEDLDEDEDGQDEMNVAD